VNHAVREAPQGAAVYKPPLSWFGDLKYLKSPLLGEKMGHDIESL